MKSYLQGVWPYFVATPALAPSPGTPGEGWGEGIYCICRKIWPHPLQVTDVKHINILSVAIVIICIVHSGVASEQYQIEATPGVGPLGINNSSQIVGWGGYPPAAYVGNVIDFTEIQVPGSAQTFGAAINDAGEIVGSTTDAQYSQEGFAWDRASGFVTPAIPLGQSSFNAINNLGAVGGSFLAANTLTPAIAAIWSASGTFTALPSLPGANASVVRSLNDAGQAVGSSGYNGDTNFGPADPNAQYGLYHAVLWQNGTATDLTPDNPESDANAINNEGQVVGYLVDPTTFISIPFIWDATNGLVDLPYYSGDSYAAAINNEGQIVGSVGSDSNPSAALWENGELFNLNDLLPVDSGWILEDATGINDLGQITG